jgi:hypothetical protein
MQDVMPVEIAIPGAIILLIVYFFQVYRQRNR